MSRDTAGRGRCAPTNVVGICDVEVINPGTAVVLKGDEKRRRYTVGAAYIRIAGPDQWATIYTLIRHGSHPLFDSPTRDEFEAAAALVELADPPAVEAADDELATVPGGVIQWRRDDFATWIDGTGPHAAYSIWPEKSLGVPLYHAAFANSTGKRADSSATGTLAECKQWCEAHHEAAERMDAAQLLLNPDGDNPTHAAVALNGEPQPVPAAAGSEF